MIASPDYLIDKASAPANNGPAALLLDGNWCGHGEPNYAVFDIRHANEAVFAVQLPVANNEESCPPVVTVTTTGGEVFAVYDSRQHPASMFHPSNNEHVSEPHFQPYLHCANCGEDQFQLSVGFEIPSDSQAPNDTSWFALAVKCSTCGWSKIIYEDETA